MGSMRYSSNTMSISPAASGSSSKPPFLLSLPLKGTSSMSDLPKSASHVPSIMF